MDLRQVVALEGPHREVADADPLCLGIHEEGRHAPVLLLPIDGRHHQEEPRVGGMGDEDLGPGEAPAALRLDRQGAQAGEIGPAAGLGETGRGEAAPIGHGRKPAPLLILGAEAQDRPRQQRIGDRDDRGDHPVDPGQLLADDPVGHHVHEGAAVLLGDHRRDVAERDELLDQLDRVAPLPLVLLDEGLDLLLGEAANRGADLTLLGREVEIHHPVEGGLHRSSCGRSRPRVDATTALAYFPPARRAPSRSR